MVERYLRVEIDERILANGKIYKDLEEEEVKTCEFFIREGINSIAICLMNSYANQEHENKIRDLLIKYGFKGHISLSSIVSGESESMKEQPTIMTRLLKRECLII